MAMNDGLKTSETQLHALQSRGSNHDWEGFYRKYAGVILNFCRKQGLDDFTSRDVLQESMILIIRKLPGFAYSPAKGLFRNWLLTLVYGKVRDARRRAARLIGQTGPDFFRAGERLQARDEEDIRAAEVEAAWKQTLIEEALRRLKQNPRIKPETMEVFDACVLQNMTISAAAEKFRMEENNIYQIKNRLIRKLREEVSDLEQN